MLHYPQYSANITLLNTLGKPRVVKLKVKQTSSQARRYDKGVRVVGVVQTVSEMGPESTRQYRFG